ncbi:MAG: CpsB/CapC family capsule biosynthesis tyrosine phosphatase [Eubacterium sp.]
MIDMHNHVLYGVDDGAKTMEDSIEMLKKAKDVGFSGVVLTPHYMCYHHFTSTVAENEVRFNALKAEIERIGLNMDLYLGSEHLYEYKLNALIDTGAFKTLGESPYFLVETIRHGGTAIGIENFMLNLQSKGYKTIFAHPERYDFVQEDPNILMEFMNRGCLIQSNYLSLTGYYGEPSKRTLETLLTHDMVQLMGSDAHQIEGYALYPQAEKLGIDLIGVEKWNAMMCVNPECILCNQGTILVEPKRYVDEIKYSVIAKTAF